MRIGRRWIGRKLLRKKLVLDVIVESLVYLAGMICMRKIYSYEMFLSFFIEGHIQFFTGYCDA